MSRVKQVIVIRKDLKMRRGKEIAQGAHASMAAVLNEMVVVPDNVDIDMWGNERTIPGSRQLFSDQELTEWLEGSFTKICLIVNSEQELLDLYNKARVAQLRVALIQDSGKTEFNGVPTHTCIAIGPNYSDKIDPLTGHLSLY